MDYISGNSKIKRLDLFLKKAKGSSIRNIVNVFPVISGLNVYCDNANIN